MTGPAACSLGQNVDVADKVLQRILSGTADAAIQHYGEINLQRDGANAKPYQVRQVRAIILEAKLGGQ